MTSVVLKNSAKIILSTLMVLYPFWSLTLAIMTFFMYTVYCK